MTESIVGEIHRLRGMTVGELRGRYVEVFGEQPRSRNKDYLWKRVAYRIQEIAEGGISERAQRRAQELARDADLRVRPNQSMEELLPPAIPKRDPRLPPAGSTLKRIFGGKEHLVQVLDEGFEYEGRRYSSLSAAARAIAGSRWNGFIFFGLAGSHRETA
jgi:hypothetical protein